MLKALTCQLRASPAAPSSHRAPSRISFVLLLPLPGGHHTGRRSPWTPSAPHASWQLVPLPRGLSPTPCPARCLLGLPPLPAPLLCHQEQFSGRGQARRPLPGCGAGLLRSQEMVQFYCTGANGTEDGTILFFLALPCSAAGALGGFFCWFVFPLCCVSSQPGQVLPLPLGLPAVSLPSGGWAAPCLSRGFFAFGCVFWLLFLISVLL